MSLITAIRSINYNFKYIYGACLLKQRMSTHRTAPECDEYDQEIKNKILEASLNYVNELGWSKKAIIAGAQSVGYPPITHGLFSRGGGDLIHHFQTSSNKKLVEILKELRTSEKSMPPPQFVKYALRKRLEMIIPFIGRWPQAIAIMSLPPNVPKALATLLTTVDDICYYAGDRSVDFNWYARRIGVAGVYKATELYLIQDKSENHEETWMFLSRRLTEAVQIHELFCKADIVNGQGAKDAAMSVFVTARNILGLNWNK